MKDNIKKLIKSKLFYMGFILGVLLIALPSYYFINSELIIGNLGYKFYVIEVVLTILICLLFGLFIGASFYKIKYFSIKNKGTGLFGGLIGILVTGCPSCSITLASYLGLSSIISVLPYNGIELKIVSILILLWVNYDIIKNLENCRLK